jgi:hypothetical protein
MLSIKPTYDFIVYFLGRALFHQACEALEIAVHLLEFLILAKGDPRAADVRPVLADGAIGEGIVSSRGRKLANAAGGLLALLETALVAVCKVVRVAIIEDLIGGRAGGVFPEEGLSAALGTAEAIPTFPATNRNHSKLRH